MRAIRYIGPGKVSLDEVQKPEPTPELVLLRVLSAGICGSDITIYGGKHPRAQAPLILGHEFSGHIASAHPNYSEGTLVSVYPHRACGCCDTCFRGLHHTCSQLRIIGIDVDGGMADWAVVPQDAVYALPEGISDPLAAFVEPVSVGVHAVRHGGYIPGDSAIVFGAGGIGLPLAITLRRFGADKLLLCEPNATRRGIAADLGFTLADSTDPLGSILDFSNGKGADFVLDCAGHQSVADMLPDSVRIGGTVIMVAGYKTPPVFNFQKGMMRELDILFIRNSGREDFTIACDLVQQELGYERLLNCVLSPEDVQQGFDIPTGALKVLFDFSERGKHEKHV
jgi:2-desacetyl-2-hydroxyethyl bacteriochlorophyllide A dehydrogenase